MLEAGMEERYFTCPVCLELFVDPVTLNCGHAFCSGCIERHWATESAARGGFTCPECRQAYSAKPALSKSILIANVVMQIRRARAGAAVAPGDHPGHYDGGVEVTPCDACDAGVTRPAVRSCVQCEMSFCEEHLAPHRQVAQLKAHELVSPSAGLCQSECEDHGRRVELFCRSDGRLLCGTACATLHARHEMVPIAREHTQRLDQLDSFKLTLQEKETRLVSFVEGAAHCSDELNRSADETQSRLLGKYEELISGMSAERDAACRAVAEERDGRLAELGRDLRACETALGGVRATLGRVAALRETDGQVAFLKNFSREWQSIADSAATPNADPPPGAAGLPLAAAAPLEQRADQLLASYRTSRGVTHPSTSAAGGRASALSAGQRRQVLPAFGAMLNQVMLRNAAAAAAGPPPTAVPTAPPSGPPPMPPAPLPHEALAPESRPRAYPPRMPTERQAEDDVDGSAGPALPPRCRPGEAAGKPLLPTRPMKPGRGDGAAGLDAGGNPQRAELVRNYGFSPMLNANSASPRLQLSRDLRSAKRVACPQSLPPHQHRFDSSPQVLAAESQFSGCRYWEVRVEWARWCTVGVAYGSIPRKGSSDLCGLGMAGAGSWCLEKDRGAYVVRHNGARIPGKPSAALRTVGVLLDWDAGALSFYDADSMKLLHAFRHVFEEPLYPALGINRNGDSVSFVNLG